MNLLAFLISTILTLSPPVWLNDFDQAKTKAKEEHKVILLNFSGSDWCGPCIRLKREVFENETFSEFAANNLVLINADFPRQKKNQLSPEQIQKNEKLAEQYNSKGIFPLTLLLDSEGKVLQKWEGYPGKTAEEVMHLLMQGKEVRKE